MSNSYYWINLFTDEECTKNYTISNIYSNVVLFVKTVLNPYPNISKNKSSQSYSSTYSNNDILNYVITSAGCTYNEPAYLKIHINVGETAVISTNTTYQNMSETLMLSLAGDRGQALNGGSFIRFERTQDSYKHNILIMSVNKSGDYYIAVTYSPAAVNNYGVSFLTSFKYVFDITATINNGFLLD